MAIVKKYPAEVVGIEQQVNDIYTISFKSLGASFKFHPGQFLHLALDEYDPGSAWPESRCFSMESAPSEDLLRITYSPKGVFTRRMADEIKIGKKVTLKLPYGGLFTQPHDKAHTVFIAGGTGITPFLSLFNDKSFSTYLSPVLFAGFRNAEANIYHDEICKASGINNGLRIFYIYEDRDGYIKPEMIMPQARLSSTFFLSGPPGMIKSLRSELILQGISENQILTDDWE